MKNLRASAGPFAERPYFEPAEIEEICREALCSVALYPAEPSPVRIDRFVEKRFGVHPIYEDLPSGLLGYTEFGANGIQRIVIGRALDDEGTRTAERRVSTTLAHEGGHGLLHAHLFALGVDVASLFGEGMDVRGSKIMCRSEVLPADGGSRPRKYDGRWWEFQANQAIGGLLLPGPLVERCLANHGPHRLCFFHSSVSPLFSMRYSASSNLVISPPILARARMSSSSSGSLRLFSSRVSCSRKTRFQFSSSWAGT